MSFRISQHIPPLFNVEGGAPRETNIGEKQSIQLGGSALVCPPGSFPTYSKLASASLRTQHEPPSYVSHLPVLGRWGALQGLPTVWRKRPPLDESSAGRVLKAVVSASPELGSWVKKALGTTGSGMEV